MSNPQPIDSMMFPRYSAIATFFRLPHITDPKELDVAIVGVGIAALKADMHSPPAPISRP